MGRSYTSKPIDAAFTLDGVEFVPAEMSLLDLSDLARYGNLDVESPEGMAAVGQFFREILGGDYDRFRAHCAKHRTSGEQLLQIVEDILLDVVGFPTPQPSDSADGLPTTGPSLKVISSGGVVRFEPLTPEREAELRAAVERAAG